MSTDTITQEEREHWRQQRIKTIREDGAVRRHPCPTCPAEVGEDCFSPSFYTGQFHVARKKLAGLR